MNEAFDLKLKEKPQGYHPHPDFLVDILGMEEARERNTAAEGGGG